MIATYQNTKCCPSSVLNSTTGKKSTCKSEKAIVSDIMCTIKTAWKQSTRRTLSDEIFDVNVRLVWTLK